MVLRLVHEETWRSKRRPQHEIVLFSTINYERRWQVRRDTKIVWLRASKILAPDQSTRHLRSAVRYRLDRHMIGRKSRSDPRRFRVGQRLAHQRTFLHTTCHKICGLERKDRHGPALRQHR